MAHLLLCCAELWGDYVSLTGLHPFLADSSTARTTVLVIAASLGHHSSGLVPALIALMHFPNVSHISVSCGLSRYTCTTRQLAEGLPHNGSQNLSTARVASILLGSSMVC